METKTESSRVLQIDLLKGLAIISVILLHTMPLGMRRDIFALFHIWQAVPVFVVIMALNAGLAFRKAGVATFREIYNSKQILGRLKRIGIPYVTVLGILALGSVARGFGGGIDTEFGFSTLFGFLPGQGPGIYFVPILFQFVLLFGLVHKLYLYNPKLMLFVAFTANLAYELAAPYVAIFSSQPLLYSASVFRYLFAIALGLWIVDNRRSSPGKLFWFGVAASTLYLMAKFFYAFDVPWFRPERGTQNVLSFFYPLLLVIAGLKYLPSTTANPAVKGLAVIGRASYHIFLVQILFFDRFKPRIFLERLADDLSAFNAGVSVILLTLATCIVLGLFFEKAMARFWSHP